MEQPSNVNKQQPDNELAEPISRIFVDWAEAEWAFDLLRETTRRLQVADPYDSRVAVTLSERSGKVFLRLNFGGWLVLGFREPNRELPRVDMVLLVDQISWDERFTAFAFDRKEGDPEVRSYELPLDVVRPMTGNLQQAYDTTLDFIVDKFQSWKKATHWKQHNPEIVEAFFDLDKRAQVFAGGLIESELRYERHFTVFNQEVAEEEENYESGDSLELNQHVDQTSVEEMKKPEEIDVEFEANEFETNLQSFGFAQGKPPISPSLNPPYPLPQLAKETGFDEATLMRWVRAIKRKGQAILYGPPGTGKTYMAKKLTQHLMGGGNGFWELVQFHPAYAYEDFVQGIRPQSKGDHLHYPLLPGRFLKFCQKADQRPDICVLIIDEINRANLARVFGELMYLLEYRTHEIPLAGGGENFRIPENVRIIGTMNTADRSIALVDHALRRRFAFLALQPNYKILRRYHQREETGFSVEGLIKLLTRLNLQIDDSHYEVGITFFLRQDLDDQIADIWQMEIEPYLEEYFFDQPHQVDAFRWAQIEKEVRLL